MKIESLKYPFSWEKRRPIIQDRVLFIPPYYQEHHLWPLPNFSDPLLFGNSNKVFVEYCSGNGEWILAKAQKHPEINWIAVEKQFERAQKIWTKLYRGALENLFIVLGAAETFNAHYLKENSIDEMFINFPDPWPKRAHAKHRLVQSPFIGTCSKRLKQSGKITLVTDDAIYSAQMTRVLQKDPELCPLTPLPHYVTELVGYGDSFFEKLFRTQGCAIRYHQYQKIASS